jgi:excisionase family DNA binding protein
MGMSTGIEHDHEARDAALPLTVMLPPDQLETVARRAADLVADGRDDGFMDVDGAAAFLSLSPKAIYHKTERDQIPHYHAGGRLLFDRAELRAWVESGG